ncbi:hypothetical protein RF11_12532 [Thelohanellus kitauei]|uniref:Uncharacterized protein n=1 Tax=Thelohanellus kitauei TaxID=669202 RepID=A0A0C2MI01_THEKT|nr:hypothetical protein RF11_12532 [Thelohanellus kitauei]
MSNIPIPQVRAFYISPHSLTSFEAKNCKLSCESFEESIRYLKLTCDGSKEHGVSVFSLIAHPRIQTVMDLRMLDSKIKNGKYRMINIPGLFNDSTYGSSTVRECG